MNVLLKDKNALFTSAFTGRIEKEDNLVSVMYNNGTDDIKILVHLL